MYYFHHYLPFTYFVLFCFVLFLFSCKQSSILIVGESTDVASGTMQQLSDQHGKMEHSRERV